MFAAQLGQSTLVPHQALTPSVVSSPQTTAKSSTSGNLGGSSDAIGPASFNSLEVPPVQFDWVKSGLENPLTGKSKYLQPIVLCLVLFKEIFYFDRYRLIVDDIGIGLFDIGGDAFEGGYNYCEDYPR